MTARPGQSLSGENPSNTLDAHYAHQQLWIYSSRLGHTRAKVACCFFDICGSFGGLETPSAPQSSHVHTC